MSRFIRANYIHSGTGETRQKDWGDAPPNHLPHGIKGINGWHYRRSRQWGGDGWVVDLHVNFAPDDQMAGQETVTILDTYFPSKDHGFSVENRSGGCLVRRFGSMKEAGKFISELCQKLAG